MKYILRESYDSSWIDQVMEVHNKTELKRTNKEKVNRAFSASFAVASYWTGDRLIAIGRMISDGEMYSGIFDVVVDPEFQKLGLGKKIVEALIAKAPQSCIHLTSTFGNESFYLKMGFKKHKTALAIYPASFGKSPYLDYSWEPNQ